MDMEEIVAVAAASTLYLSLIADQEKKKKRKIWTKSWLKRRNDGKGPGILRMLNEELKTEDPAAYRQFLRMTNPQFHDILSYVENEIKKENTHLREAISAQTRLEVTLRFLATGESYRSLMFATRIHESTISKFIPEVCSAIYKKLKIMYLKTPNTTKEWESIAEEFDNVWQFPNCLGALDGRHITFRPPISEGSYYYNYKGDQSIVLLGLADAKYKFTYVNVGVNGRISDGGVFNQSKLSNALQNNFLKFPPARRLPGREIEVPYVIVADDAFSLSTKLLKPYPFKNLAHDNKIFNYRLSRARRIIENSFGILANRFRVLLNPISLSASKVEIITLACIVLHNYLVEKNCTNYTEGDAAMENPLRQISKQNNNRRSTTTAQKVRDEFRDYFNSPQGQVDWQEDAIARHNM